jgi:hypothetical protein
LRPAHPCSVSVGKKVPPVNGREGKGLKNRGRADIQVVDIHAGFR